ncbi:MAPEG family protein [Sphingomicrobium astaxanthinifaciens]|uniref:MAPEG family protein n=1 Tax=Sphingomicrobium astaxanthinifaciens TaxID=1227949 RepID=UPI001FCB7093|nr:MAPEG family protein [Sphingomicrobium astaxanthinifaciens]MCJ7422356.1 MAPEG family protein [Sphingomicrobium astaxanthinifaciens]
MHFSPILGPVVTLVAWTLLMLFWAVAKALAGAKASSEAAHLPRTGTRLRDLEPVSPREAAWARHNYEHLHEQPTLFYAIALALALMGMGDGLNLWLAWGYVGLRIVHSLIQATANISRLRTAFFLLSTLCLIALTVHAGAELLHHL